MTRDEIIELTLQQVEYRRNPLPAKIVDPLGLEADDDTVIAELNDRLPDGDIKTCEDFKDLGVDCCDNCHKFYPHYDMDLLNLPDGSRGWICCSVRQALLEPDSVTDESSELVDTREVLGGNLTKTGREP